MLNMKVYEFGWEGEEDKVVWIATDREIVFMKESTEESDSYCREIDISPDSGGIDLVIK